MKLNELLQVLLLMVLVHNSDNDNNDGTQSQQSLEKSNLLAMKLYQSTYNANKSAAFLEQMLKSGNIKQSYKKHLVLLG